VRAKRVTGRRENVEIIQRPFSIDVHVEDVLSKCCRSRLNESGCNPVPPPVWNRDVIREFAFAIAIAEMRVYGAGHCRALPGRSVGRINSLPLAAHEIQTHAQRKDFL